MIGAVGAGVYFYIDHSREGSTTQFAAVTERAPTKDETVDQSLTNPATPEIPARIVIDKIAVDATIESVGLTDDGMMDAPNSNHTVGWYHQSAKAGESKLAMLLDGHYGIGQAAAVFRRLPELTLGDTIAVHGEHGATLTYKVVETEQQYTEDVDMRKALYPYRPGVQSLTIITCEGEYLPEAATYDRRTIVYAERVS